MSLQRPLKKISARKAKTSFPRICQGDIFKDIEVLEDVGIKGAKILIQKISFPYIVCLNQECDLNKDYNEMKVNYDNPGSSKFLHLAIAPAFNFEHFLVGNHWGEVFKSSGSVKRDRTQGKLIIDNEILRFHYLKFPDNDMPELIVDFKHFFTVNRDFLYRNLDKRLCSLDDLFREKLSQRFSNFISRIGLPELDE